MNVLWVSECPFYGSGFGKVSYYMIKGLKELGFNVVSTCFATMTSLKYDGIDVYPYGNPLNEFVEFISNKHGKVDVVVFHGAPWITPLSDILPQTPYLKDVRTVGYFVHEFVDAPTSIKNYFKLVNLLVTPTEFVAKVLGIKRYSVVHHGVNPEIWRPYERKGDRETRTLCMIAKNHPRKRWDMFLRVLRELPNVRGLAYTSVLGYWNILAIAETLGVKERLKYPSPYETFHGLTETEMCNVVRDCDIHILLSNGEAWGLPITETLAMGIPNVVMDYPAIREWCGEFCYYYDIGDTFISPNEGTLHHTPNFLSVMITLTSLLSDYDNVRDEALLNSELIRKRFEWSEAVKQMAKALDKVMTYDNLIIEEEQSKIRRIELKPRSVE